MQQGEIIITGKGEVFIPLNAFPSEVRAYFVGEPELVPCDPHELDTIEYEVHSSNHCHGGFVLRIKYKVHSERKVVWKAEY